MEQHEVLNVTTLPPREKHPAIFAKFEALNPGGSLVIRNDHDPKPLYYQMLAELGPVFSWNYLQQGPEEWQVKITKNQGKDQSTVGEIAASDMRKAEVFKKFGIDFCCGGKKTLKEACDEKQLDPEKIESALDEVAEQTSGQLRFNQWNLTTLADYIIDNHHGYVRQTLPEIKKFAHKVAQVHGDQHPELKEIRELSGNLAEELTAHMQKEEQILFPYIQKMEEGQKEGKVETPPFGSIRNPIRMMESEHDSAGNNIEKIKALSNDFTPPQDACNSFRFLFHLLKDFKADLNQHIHLENNILFPKAIEMEKQLLANS